MRNKLACLLAGASAMLFLAAGVAAAKATTVHVMYQVEFKNGATLNPGNYRVAVVNNSGSSELAFYQNRRQMAEEPVKLVSEPQKIGQTEVYYDTANHSHVLTEIDLRGWNQKVMFPEGSNQ